MPRSRSVFGVVGVRLALVYPVFLNRACLQTFNGPNSGLAPPPAVADQVNHAGTHTDMPGQLRLRDPALGQFLSQKLPRMNSVLEHSGLRSMIVHHFNLQRISAGPNK